MEDDMTAIFQMINEYFDNCPSDLPTISISQFNRQCEDGDIVVLMAIEDSPHALGDVLSALTDLSIEPALFHNEKIDSQSIFSIALRSEIKKIDDIDTLMSKLENSLGKDVGLFRYRICGVDDTLMHMAMPNCPEKIITCPYSLFHTLLRTITNSMGSGGDYILYLAGVNTANYFWNKYDLGKKDELEEQLQVIEEFTKSLGFGTIVFEGIDPLTSKGMITIQDPMEACAGDTCPCWDLCNFGKVYRARNTPCTFTRGLLTELLRRIFDDNEVEILETNCVTRGDSVCKYELSRGRH